MSVQVAFMSVHVQPSHCVCVAGGIEQRELPVQVVLSIALTSTQSSGLGRAHFQMIY